MSIESITIAEFAMLTLAQNQCALALYNQEIEYLGFLLDPSAVTDGDASADVVREWEEKLENYQKLRDVHQNRIDELTTEASETDGSTVATAA